MFVNPEPCTPHIVYAPLLYPAGFQKTISALSILSMILMLIPPILTTPSVGEAHAATWLGLHVTQEELNCWKQRAGVAPQTLWY
jgi:hypothetical protein